MPITDRELPQVVVNKLTQAQYSTATKSADEFYLVTDAKVEGSDIDWSTFQRPTTEVVAGKWSDGSVIYAQRFTGTFTTSTNSRVTIELLAAGSAKFVVKAEGAYSPNSSSPNVLIGPMLSTSGFNIDSIASVDAPSDGRLRFMVSAQAYNGQTGSYDIVVYYTKP